MKPHRTRLPLSILSALAAVGLSLPTAGTATTAPTAPIVSTSVTSGVTESAATLYGYVNPNGQETTYAFQYGTTSGYGTQTPLTSAGDASTSVKISQSISGLQAHTTYHYRVIATNASGTTQGEDATFTTPAAPGPPAPVAPTVDTSGVSNVTYSSGVLYGYVNPKGQATTYAFQYGTTTAYGSETPIAAAGSGTATDKVSQTLTGLAPFTLYHYRIVASSAAGKTTGSDRAFTTAKVPLSLQIVGSPNPVIFGSPFVIDGTLSGTGGANHEVVLQAKQFPFTAGFATIGNPEVTNALGSFSFPVIGLDQNAHLRVMTVGTPSLTSPSFSEQVAVRATVHARRTRRRGIYRLYGTVTPAEVGALVGFQLLKPGQKSVNQGGTVVTAATATTSKFSRRVHIRHPGLYRALIKIPDGAHVSSYSEPILIR
jgi:hypothetical protein